MRRAKKFRYGSRPPSSNDKLKFDCELLEDRHLLSGMVSVSVRGSVLNIVGDGLDNEVHMSGLNVTGESGTTISRDQSYFDDLDKVRSVSIKLMDGDDVLRVSNLSIAGLRGNLTIDGGNDNNNIRVDDSGVKNLTVKNGFGNDILVINRTQVGDDRHGNLNIDNGDGESRVWISSALGIGKSVHGNVAVSNRGQYSQLIMTGVRVRNGNITVKHDTASDVQIENCDKIKNINVTTGSALSGSHRFQLSTTDVHGNVNVKNAFGTAETIIDDLSLIGKNVNISTQSLEFLSRNCDTQVLQSSIGGALKITNKMAGTQTELISGSVFEKGMTLTQQSTYRADLAAASNHTVNIQGGTEAQGKVSIKTKGFDGSQQNVHIQNVFFVGDVDTSTSVRSNVQVENSAMKSLRGGAATVSGNQFVVSNTVLSNDLKISHSRSGNLVTVKNSFIGNNLYIASGGFDPSGLESVLIEGTVVGRNLYLYSAAENSVAALRDVQIDRDLKIKLMGELDTVSLDDVIILGKTDLNLIGGGGASGDIVWIEQGNLAQTSQFYGAVKIRTGAGNDVIEIGTALPNDKARFEWTALVDGGAGIDEFRYSSDTYFAFGCDTKNIELP